MLDQAIGIETKVSPGSLHRARLALTAHAGCFWMRQPAVSVQNRADIELIIRRLRENGDVAAWQTAWEIEACL